MLIYMPFDVFYRIYHVAFGVKMLTPYFYFLKIIIAKPT